MQTSLVIFDPMETLQVRKRALDSVPVAMPGVSARFDSAGRAQLRREVPSETRLFRWLGWPTTIRVDLDPAGTAFWRLVDGRRRLREIAAHLARDLQTDLETAERATLDFARELMLRHLIGLRTDQ